MDKTWSLSAHGAQLVALLRRPHPHYEVPALARGDAQGTVHLLTSVQQSFRHMWVAGACTDAMLSMDSLQVAEEEVVESTSSRLEDIYTFLAEGCYPQSMSPIRRKNLKRYALKFIIEGNGSVGGVARRSRQSLSTVCETCQHAERSKNMSRTGRPIKVESPWEVLSIEVFGPFPETKQGNTNVVIITDYLSKWVEASPVQKGDSLSVARCISTAIYRFGSVKTVLCSESADFCDEVSKHLHDRWTIVQKVSPVEQSQVNTLYDHSSSLLKEAIRQVVTEKQAEWDDYVDSVLFVFRTSANPTTKFTPYYLMFNREATLPSEVIANMNAAYKQEKKNAKRRVRNIPSITFKVEDPLFGTRESPPLKKLKESLLLPFPVEAVLDSEQSGSDEKKSDLEYPLPVSGVP
ncbi:gypsy retrotransposon integrase-like protein 1-like [Scleropages formosus]|uniref:Gypsy retrotransposon integrase-like protein 1-like n=1 Tax=Scleropages formosus TaxID=113540 RepID=A0A0P7VL77_SCLFO|nr:gypsy retrotransposon integrase-like protein 1-like [Scleropages formosus]